MSEASVIHMSSLGNEGAPDVAIPLTADDEIESTRRRNPLRVILDLSLTQLLAFICGILALIIIGLAISTGYALITDSNQHARINNQDTRISNLGNRANELQQQINSLENRVATLENK